MLASNELLMCTILRAMLDHYFEFLVKYLYYTRIQLLRKLIHCYQYRFVEDRS